MSVSDSQSHIALKTKMLKNDNILSCSRRPVAFALLFLLIFLIYSNTFHASWHLDDYHNIIDNPHLHISHLQPGSLVQTFFASHDDGLYQGNKIYRPIPCLTFAINWYFGKDNVVGYHIVNITIHFLAAFILFLTILNLFKSPRLKAKYQQSEYFIAVLSATLWAINPIQIQAVTYIVQRMASLAAMFYILGIYFYVKGRVNNSRRNQVFLYSGCLLSFVFALGCKENGAMLPVALFLVEIAFFQDIGLPKTRRIFLGAAAGIGLLVILLGILFFMKGDPLSFLKGYEKRTFTLLERLITEPRILIFYLTQIFYPVPNRLSVVHNVTISTSLLEPWTTIPAILTVFLLIGIGVSQLRKRPIVAFAILFFFLNHIIESTILPLELVFEHRNYLPSFFLFFPVSAGLKWLIDYYYEHKRSMYLIVGSFITILVIGLGSGTYIRNLAWGTEKTLWEDAIPKASGKARPLHNLAWGHHVRIGHFDKALQLFEKALLLTDPKQRKHQAAIYHNVGNIYYEKHEFEKAAELYKKAVHICPKYNISQYNMILALVKDGRWEEASENADLLLSKRHDYKDYLDLKGFILLKQKRPGEAIPYLKSALRIAPNYGKAILNIGVALSLTGEHEQARWFLRRASQMSPNEIIILFSLIQNSLRTGDKQDTDKYIERLFTSFNIKDIIIGLIELPNDNLSVPVSRKILAPVIAKKLKEKSKDIAGLGYCTSDGMQYPNRK